MQQFQLDTGKRIQMIDITSQVTQVVEKEGITDGICLVYVPHTTAGVTINEAYDPSVSQDIESFMQCLVPRSNTFKHTEGNSDAHIKASLMGSSVYIPVENGRLFVGRWQGIFFCEFDGPRRRVVCVKTIGTS